MLMLVSNSEFLDHLNMIVNMSQLSNSNELLSEFNLIKFYINNSFKRVYYNPTMNIKCRTQCTLIKFKSINALFVFNPLSIHSSKMMGLYYASLDSNYIGYYADIKTLFPTPHVQVVDYYYKMVEQMKKVWKSYVADDPKLSNCDRLNKFRWYQLLYYAECDGDGHDYFLIFGFKASRYKKKWVNGTEIDLETETETYVVPEIGICEETGVVSVTPTFPPNCRKILIEFLAYIKLLLLDKDVDDEEEVMEGFRRDITKHLKFGVTGRIDYDD